MKIRLLALLLAACLLWGAIGVALAEAALPVGGEDAPEETFTDDEIELPAPADVAVGAKDAGKAESNAKPKSVSLNKKKLTLKVGGTATLKATLKPAGAKSKLKWTSSNKKVAKVNASGKVTAVGKGTAKITVETANKRKATCTVTVKAATVELFNYYGKNMYDVAKKFKGLTYLPPNQEEDRPCGSYTGKYFYMGEAGPSSPEIADLGLIKAGNYTLCGVKVGMKKATAQKKLKAFANKRGKLTGGSSESWEGNTYYQYTVKNMKTAMGRLDVYVTLTIRKGAVTRISLSCGG